MSDFTPQTTIINYRTGEIIEWSRPISARRARNKVHVPFDRDTLFSCFKVFVGGRPVCSYRSAHKHRKGKKVGETRAWAIFTRRNKRIFANK